MLGKQTPNGTEALRTSTPSTYTNNSIHYGCRRLHRRLRRSRAVLQSQQGRLIATPPEMTPDLQEKCIRIRKSEYTLEAPCAASPHAHASTITRARLCASVCIAPLLAAGPLRPPTSTPGTARGKPSRHRS